MTAPSSQPDARTAREHAETVLARLQHGYHDEGHHPYCATGEDEGCDCYARASAPARASLRALLAQVERLEQERDETRDGLVTLRGAWNAHMARCDLDAERQAEINRFVPTFEQIQAWANAPSNTASAETPEGEGR